MDVYVDASGDDGQMEEKGASEYFTLGIIINDTGKPEVMNQIFTEFTKQFVEEIGHSFKPELSWNKLDDHEREFIAKNLLSRKEILPVIIAVDKFSEEGGWADARLNEPQFRTHVLRSMLWVVCSHVNLCNICQPVTLTFDKELAEAFARPLNKEAHRIKSKEITLRVGVDSKDSFGIQMADCLAGCFNHFALEKSNFYSIFRENVCEIRLTANAPAADKPGGKPEIKLGLRMTDLAKLLR